MTQKNQASQSLPNPVQRLAASVKDEFWSRVNKTSECWEWTGERTGRSHSYGDSYNDALAEAIYQARERS